MALPVLVLAPGAWHTPQLFEKIIPGLESRGFTCSSVSFPSVGREPPIKDATSDVQAVRDVVEPYVKNEQEVAILVHSWSGAIVNSALEGLGKEEQRQKGRKGGVIKLLFVSAFVVLEGISLFEAMGNKVPGLWDIQGDVVYVNNPIPTFYGDLELEQAEYYASLLRPHAKASKYFKTTGAAWKTIPSVYLICEEDRAIPSFIQEEIVKGAREAGANMSVERITSSHSPFLSRPDEVVEFIIRNVEGA